MFQKARIKLTAWYVLITMVVSIIFSVMLYTVLVHEVQRFGRTQRYRIEHGNAGGTFISPDMQVLPSSPVQELDMELEQQTIQDIQIILVLLNGGIFILSACLCYFLAGKTLEPIQTMVNEQHQFVSDASHELKTPLTAMRTTFEVALRNKDLTLHEAKEVITENLVEIESLQNLSETLLKLSSFQKNNIEKYFETIRVHELLENAIKKVKPLAQEKNIEILVNESEKEAMVQGIPHQLTELLVILLDNAIKYSPAKTHISLSTKVVNKNIKIAVKDEGPGIPKEDVKHIFDRFYRGDKSRTRSGITGYGLGLAIAKQVAELHHGKIEVESNPEPAAETTHSNKTGSTFSLLLPIQPAKV